MQDLSNVLENVCLYAEEAGDLILQHYLNRTYTVTQKSDKTPVTEADWEAHLLLLSKLTALSSYPVISEESHNTGDALPENSPFWLVDPLDGTKEFIRGTDHFTVNVALIDGNYPVLGVIHIPVTGETFFASHSQGAFKRLKDGAKQQIRTVTFNKNSPRLFVSRDNPHELEQLRKKWPHAHFTPMGSSLKYCRIAEGASDLYIRYSRTFEWDTAAAQCILEEAGGKLCDLSGVRLQYRKVLLENKGLIAFGDSTFTL